MSLLETARMRFRPLIRGDVDNVHGIFSDPVAMRFSLTGVRDRQASSDWVERAIRLHEEHGHGFWAVTLKGQGAYVGHAGLLLQEVEGRPEVEIAYWFLREHWGQGLATEAAIACRDYGFGTLGRRRLISLIVPGNAASRRVAEKAGLRLEREAGWKKTRVCVYAIEREERD